MALPRLFRGNLMQCQNFAPTFVDHQVLPNINFNGHGHCLININISILKKVINLHISYILNPWLRNLNADFTLNNYLFGSVQLTKNADSDKYVYSGYGIGFDSRSEFSLTDGSVGKDFIIFGADMRSLWILIIREKIYQFLVKDQHKD